MKQFTFCFLLLCMLPSLALGETLTLTNAQISQMAIKTTMVTASKGDFSRTYTGEIALPNQQLQIVSAPQTGLIAALKFAPGQTVKKGQLIAQMTSPDLVNLQGEYLQAKTQLALATKTASREKALAEEGIIPERRYITAKSELTMRTTEVMQKQQALRLAGMTTAQIHRLNSAQLMQSMINIVAPMTGQLIAQASSVGDRIDSGMPIYQIAQLNPLWVEMHVPVEQAALLKAGQLVTIPKFNASGHIVTILRQVDKVTQTLQVRAEINHGAALLSLGQFVDVALALNDATSAISVPTAALLRNGDKSYVFKRIKTGFEIVPIKIIQAGRERALVEGALSNNDEIAMSGLAALKGRWLGLGGE